MKIRTKASNIILVIILIALLTTVVSAKEVQSKQPREKGVETAFSLSPLSTEATYLIPDSIEECQNLLDECESKKESAHKMAESARNLEYSESHYVIELAKEEWDKADYLEKIYRGYLVLLQEKELEKKEARWLEEFPTAATIWIYLKDLGLNDYVAAGILGNIMTECGGQSFELNPLVYDAYGDYYGMCQWSKVYYPEVQGKDLTYQCDFLANTMQEAIEACGVNYSSFLELTNEQDAALMFAKYYERCHSSSYYSRQLNATVAYNYFVD